jgi:hypothetical protein
MKKRNSKWVYLLLGLCVAAVGLLSAYRATANVSLAQGGIGHICIGEMDFDFQAPAGQRNIWDSESAGHRLKGCTYPKYGFESSLRGERYVVAGSPDRRNAVVGYVVSEAPENAVRSAVVALEEREMVSVDTTALSADSTHYALLLGVDEDLQIIGVPFVAGRSLLIVVRTPPAHRRSMLK